MNKKMGKIREERNVQKGARAGKGQEGVGKREWNENKKRESKEDLKRSKSEERGGEKKGEGKGETKNGEGTQVGGKELKGLKQEIERGEGKDRWEREQGEWNGEREGEGRKEGFKILKQKMRCWKFLAKQDRIGERGDKMKMAERTRCKC